MLAVLTVPATGDQLRELVTATRTKQIEIRVLPLAPFGALSLEAPFALLEMTDDDSVLYRESTLSDELLDNRDLVARYRDIVAQMLEKSLSVEASIRVIEAKIAALASALDRI